MTVTRTNVARRNRLLFLAGACLIPTCAAWAQGSDDQYDITIKMEMVGMPMALPPISQRLCVRKGAKDEDFVPRQQNCRVSDLTRTGSRVTFKIACTGNNAMTGAGDFVFASNGYSGQMRLKGKMEGQDMEMTQSIDARRTGSCTAG
ncbi:MAG TPA: DUF3617 family protein [Casimicrobiaceae bacterium]|nr:DUF3617 family protein [Casimicrobiaceae bacterium]